MAKLYDYVGPLEIKAAVVGDPTGVSITSPADLRTWSKQQDEWDDDHLTVTFVVVPNATLRVAPRRSEHVACALGEPVLTAGELTLRLEPRTEIIEATNQSTGYCPEPSSWEAARAALTAAGIPCPTELTHAYVFRLCTHCGERNLIKDDWFECDSCGQDLAREWNFELAPPQPEP